MFERYVLKVCSSTRSTGFNPGNYMSLDWGIGKKLDDPPATIPGSQSGQRWFRVQQSDHQRGTRDRRRGGRRHPQSQFLGITLRYSHEYESFARFQGDLVTLTFSVPIDMQLPSAPPPEARPAAPPAESAPSSPDTGVTPPPVSESSPQTWPDQEDAVP